MSYADFAEKVGVNPNTVSRWFMEPSKKGHQNIGDENTRKIEKAFGMEAGEIDRPESPGARAQRARAPDWPFSAQLRERVDKLTEKQRSVLEGRLLEIVEQMLNQHTEETKVRSSKSRRKRG